MNKTANGRLSWSPPSTPVPARRLRLRGASPRFGSNEQTQRPPIILPRFGAILAAIQVIRIPVTGSLDIIIPNDATTVALELVHNDTVLATYAPGAEPPEPKNIHAAASTSGPTFSAMDSAFHPHAKDCMDFVRHRRADNRCVRNGVESQVHGSGEYRRRIVADDRRGAGNP